MKALSYDNIRYGIASTAATAAARRSRRSADDGVLPGKRNGLAIGTWMVTERRSRRGDLKRFTLLSRRRAGWCGFRTVVEAFVRPVAAGGGQKRSERSPTVRSMTRIAAKVRKMLSEAIAAAVGSKLKRR